MALKTEYPRHCRGCYELKEKAEFTFSTGRTICYCMDCWRHIKREQRKAKGAISREVWALWGAAKEEDRERQRQKRRIEREQRQPTPSLKQTHLKEYWAWVDMKKRCLKRTHPKYHRYGGRGIAICVQWMQSFEQFFFDVGSAPSKRLSIDRIDNDGNYEPGNVRWATIEQQHASQTYGSRR